MDCGIIANVKLKYRNKVLKKKLSQKCEWNPTIFDVIKMISNSWRDVKVTTICNCWIKSKIILGENSYQTDIYDEEDIRDMQSFSISISELLIIDNDCIEIEPLDEVLIMRKCIDIEEEDLKKESLNEELNESRRSDGNIEVESPVSAADAIQSLSNLTKFVMSHGKAAFTQSELMILASLEEKIVNISCSRVVQTDIRNYFT